MKKTIIIMLCAGFVYWGASPYIAVYQIKEAIESNDSEKLISYIDFPSIRQSVKEHLILAVTDLAEDNPFIAADAELQDNPFVAVGVALGIGVFGNMADAYISPQALRSRMDSEDISIPDFSLSYVSVDRFLITIPTKRIKFVMLRNGLFDWKLSAVYLPDFNDILANNVDFLGQ